MFSSRLITGFLFCFVLFGVRNKEQIGTMLTDGEETRMTQFILYFSLPLYANGVQTERTEKTCGRWNPKSSENNMRTPAFRKTVWAVWLRWSKGSWKWVCETLGENLSGILRMKEIPGDKGWGDVPAFKTGVRALLETSEPAISWRLVLVSG